MQVELNELELRYAGLRVRDAARAARMRASLAADGQQSLFDRSLHFVATVAKQPQEQATGPDVTIPLRADTERML